MKKSVILFIMVGLLCVIGCKKEDKPLRQEENHIQDHPDKKVAQSISKITEESVIQFTEDYYDFKEIKKGEVVTHVFKFTNIGKRPLLISEVRPSCGCTTPKYTTEPVYPGKKGEVTVTFDSSNFKDEVFKTVAVSGNFETKIIKFKAKVN